LRCFDDCNEKHPFVQEEDIHMYNHSRIWVKCGRAKANLLIKPNVNDIKLSKDSKKHFTYVISICEELLFPESVLEEYPIEDSSKLASTYKALEGGFLTE
jgi:hypothetical protein